MRKIKKPFYNLTTVTLATILLLSFNVQIQAIHEEESKPKASEAFDPKKFLGDFKKQVKERDKLTDKERKKLIKTLENAKDKPNVQKLPQTERRKLRDEIQKLIRDASIKMSTREKLDFLLEKLNNIKKLSKDEKKELIKDIEAVVKKALEKNLVKRHERTFKKLFELLDKAKKYFSEKQMEKINSLMKKLREGKEEEKEEKEKAEAKKLSEESQEKVEKLQKRINELSEEERDVLFKILGIGKKK